MSSNAEHQERFTRFLDQMMKFGTVKGFKYFVSYIRSREELIISVSNSSTLMENSSYSELEYLKQAYEEQFDQSHNQGDTLSSSDSLRTLPYDRRCLMLSLRMQKQLNQVLRNDTDEFSYLSPASPSETEAHASDENSTLFLVGCYSKYGAPYAWLRSNHERLLKLSTEENEDKDWPLNLRTVKSWRNQDVTIWQMVAEIVKLCAIPSPINPFEIDLNYFTNLNPSACCYASAAMIQLLGEIISKNPGLTIYASKVLEDIQTLGRLHYESVIKLSAEGAVTLAHR